jgi:hypothetical protein
MYIIIILIILFIILYSNQENFATRRKKATAVQEWFSITPNPTYTKYKNDLGHVSNVVEYEDALRLHQNDQFTVKNIEKII